MSQQDIEIMKQSVNFLNKFFETLRVEKSVNLLNLYSYNDIANLHIAMVKLNQFFANVSNVENVEDDMNDVEVI